MKRIIKKYKIIIPASLLLLVVIMACSKSFLDKPPLGSLNPQIVATKAGVQGLLIGAYSLVDGVGARLAGSALAYTASLFVGNGIALAAYMVVRRRKEALPALAGHWKTGLAGGVG